MVLVLDASGPMWGQIDVIETCGADPCVVGAELAAPGVDFAWHVEGFDISEPLAKTQSHCLAENRWHRHPGPQHPACKSCDTSSSKTGKSGSDS